MISNNLHDLLILFSVNISEKIKNQKRLYKGLVDEELLVIYKANFESQKIVSPYIYDSYFNIFTRNLNQEIENNKLLSTDNDLISLYEFLIAANYKINESLVDNQVLAYDLIPNTMINNGANFDKSINDYLNQLSNFCPYWRIVTKCCQKILNKYELSHEIKGDFFNYFMKTLENNGIEVILIKKDNYHAEYGVKDDEFT